MSKAGGKRKGAGRKPAPYKTKTIAFRVRVEWADGIKAMVKDRLHDLSSGKKSEDTLKRFT
jgi:hypothetical protein